MLISLQRYIAFMINSEPIFTAKCFRTVPQLILEWVMALVGAILLLFGMAASVSGIISLLLGLATLYGLIKMRQEWSRKPIAVYNDGSVKLGKERFSRSDVVEISVTSEKIEPGLIIGQTVLTYEEVVEGRLILSNGTSRKIRLKKGDYISFIEALGRIHGNSFQKQEIS